MAGLASAVFLLRAGHAVTLFERFHIAQAIGAGILLQPTGLTVLQRLGLLETVRQQGACISGLHGITQSGRCIMDLHYEHLAPGLYGVGIHRGSLFAALYRAALDAGATLCCGCEITDIKQVQDKAVLCDTTAHQHGPFDAVIIANGTQSGLRRFIAAPQSHKPYPWGALWTILPDPQQDFTGLLQQRYAGAHTMTGILPSGVHPQNGQPCVSFFWSLPIAAYPRWQQQQRNLDSWKQQLLNHWPALEHLLQTLHNPQDLTLASYGDVVMRRWHHHNLLCIGDAAHGMSPQLGQGTNLALIDAMVMADCLAQEKNIPQAFAAYTRQRRRHLRFYQFASRRLTPLVQSHSRGAGVWRDFSFPLMHKVPFTYRQALRTVAGLKTGWVLDQDVLS